MARTKQTASKSKGGETGGVKLARRKKIQRFRKSQEDEGSGVFFIS